MADNYLERKMEEYRRGKTAAPRRRIIPSGAVRPQVTVPLGDVTVLVAGADEPLVTAFANAGAAVRFCNAAGDDAAPLSAGAVWPSVPVPAISLSVRLRRSPCLATMR